MRGYERAGAEDGPYPGPAGGTALGRQTANAQGPARGLHHATLDMPEAIARIGPGGRPGSAGTHNSLVEPLGPTAGAPEPSQPSARSHGRRPTRAAPRQAHGRVGARHRLQDVPRTP